MDTTRANWLLEQMVKIKRPVVLVGESGTSKTATTQNFLNHLNNDTTVRMIYYPNCYNFMSFYKDSYCLGKDPLLQKYLQVVMFATGGYDGLTNRVPKLLHIPFFIFL